MNKLSVESLAARIKELGDKSTQILIFLSFALVVVATLGANPALGPSQKSAMSLAMRWWLRAVYPVLVAILPLKEFRENNLSWYRFIRILKFILIWIAILFIFFGARNFSSAI